ncbi:MAG TPA: hypothetical protein VMX13_11130 [Sedimentisphaerales bacterium]|nr:hypothetical protein [Sedimentisphaerales bacterium]
MRSNGVDILLMLAFLSGVGGACAGVASAVESKAPQQEASASAGPDLYLAGQKVVSHEQIADEQVLIFHDGFSMSVGSKQLSSNGAVVRLKVERAEFDGRVRANYRVEGYLEGNLSVRKGRGGEPANWSQKMIEQGRSMLVWCSVSGEVFVTSEDREIGDANQSELYKRAVAASSAVGHERVVRSEKAAPESGTERAKKRPVEPGTIAREAKIAYPVNVSPAGEASPKMDVNSEPNGAYVVTVVGRLYVWQKQERAGLLELRSDNAVIWYRQGDSKAEADAGGAVESGSFSSFSAGGSVTAIYMSGDVELTEGQRTVRADELYYDFEQKKALAVNAVLRSFDAKRGIPIYVRAAKLRQLAENKFSGENVTLTSSEFHLPQVSISASSILITDTSAVDEQQGRVSDSSYDAQMRDVRFKAYDKTIFYWPFFRGNLQRPDTALKSVHAGYDSDWGAILETRWYLSRLLGLEEPEGTESTFALDYYSDRGVGSGAEIKYARENYFGRLIGYVINDRGEDDLGRADSRRNLEPPRELRGRFRSQHRQFLPHDWQLTTEVSYLSDENFLEGYFRNEFNVGKGQETLAHLKRIEDNQGLSLLGKVRINDFVNELEELPSIEYHLTGQSFWDDHLTLYSDSQASRFRERFASSSSSESAGFSTFLSERAEVDMPMTVGSMKVVPFVAGTAGYDDGRGFWTNIDGEAGEPQDSVWIGEAGARVSTQYWKTYPNVRSGLWDLNQLRHIIKPHLTAVSYGESDMVAEQRDTLNVGISQRLQTKRGIAEEQHTVDWMRLDTDITWVNDSGDTSGGPDRFIWNKPFIPLVDTFSNAVPPRDRRSSDVYGPRRNYISGDYIWRVSDTTAILSDMNFDIQSGVVQQFNVGFSRLVWPDLSYYIGSRYLRRLRVPGEQGSNVFTFAATYVLDPRYTVVFSQQYDFDYGASIQSDITLIRRYHRVYWGITYSADESLDKQAIVFSIWPQGVPELAIGPTRYLKVGDSAEY